MVDQIIQTYQLSERRACQIVGIHRASYRYQVAVPDETVAQVLQQLAAEYPQWGMDKMCGWLRNQGYPWNHKRVKRVYRTLDLPLPQRRRKRLPARERTPLQQAPTPHHCWSMDFMGDRLATGQRFRTLNIMDDFNREVLAIEVQTSIPATHVIRVLERLIDWHGKPKHIRIDNGPEFIAKRFEQWTDLQGINRCYIEPGKPSQNAYIERFNRTFREDILDRYWFESLEQARQLIDEWMHMYNTIRPHEALKNMTPCVYKQQYTLLLTGTN